MKKWLILVIVFFAASCGAAVPDQEILPEDLPNENIESYPLPGYPSPDEQSNVSGPENLSGDPASFEGILAFHSNRNGSLQLYVLDGQTGVTQQVPTNASQAYEPVWSSDCQALLYTHEVASPKDSEIHTVTIDQSIASPLLLNPRLETLEWAPAWSSDDQRVAFQTNPQALMNVCFASISGEDQGCLKQENFSNGHPSWSPDDDNLLFISNRDGDWDVYRYDFINNVEFLLTENRGVDFHPHYSPDGSQIIFQSDRVGNFDIYVMNADGTGERQLTFHDQDDVEPRWAGNDKIVFSSFRDEDWEIYMLDLQNNDLNRITFLPGDDKGPAWCLPNE